MSHYLIRRLLQAIPLLVLTSVVVFTLIKLAPGGPLAAYEDNPYLTAEEITRLETQLGLNQPAYVQYFRWAGKVLQGDWGYSHSTRRPVLAEIAARLPNTLQLMSLAFVLSLTLGMSIGMLSAVKQYSWFDHVATALAFIGQAVPVFWFGLILIIIFHVWLNVPVNAQGEFALHYLWHCDTCAPLFPGGGMNTYGLEDPPWTNRLYHLVLPVLMLSIVGLGSYARYTRAAMLDVIHQDYIRTARSKGLSGRAVVWGHALKNAAIPVVTIVALRLPFLFGGALYTETIFSWPGLGRLFYRAALRVDYPLLLGIVLMNAVLIIGFNLLADVVYVYLDPRIRYENV